MNVKLLFIALSIAVLTACKGVINHNQIQTLLNVCNNNGGISKIIAEQSISVNDKVRCADGAVFEISTKGEIVK